MLVLAHANHPELFVAGLLVGAVITFAMVAYKRVRK